MATYTILTRNGVADAGQDDKLEQLVAELQNPDAKLLIHLHGGLVDQAAGEAGATRLSGSGLQSWQLGPEWTQIYVVWRTGALETIRTNWTELVHDDRLYQTILRKLIGFVARRLGVPTTGGRGAASLAMNEVEILRRLTGKADRQAPFDDVDGHLPHSLPTGSRAVLMSGESDGELALEFQTELGEDEDFQRAIADIDEAINVTSGARSPSIGADIAAGQAALSRLSKDIQVKLKPPVVDPATGTRGVLTASVALLTHVGKIGVRCFKRFRSGRDHGLHATIVEEVCREFYGDLVGAKIWGMMVHDAAEHFEAGGLGAALVDILKAKTPPNIVLTAHSAGAIWASHLLVAMKDAGVAAEVKLFLLAPAVRHDLFARTIEKVGALIGPCRMVTMTDEFERRDAVLGHDKGYIYPSSLLYLVSGMFEEEATEPYPDVPILGMQRFLSASWLTPKERGFAERIATFFQAPDRGVVSSPTAGVAMAESHGAFDDEVFTLATVRALF
jgi:hypothetical protein